jgi:hypothetical protein
MLDGFKNYMLINLFIKELILEEKLNSIFLMEVSLMEAGVDLKMMDLH